MIVNGVEISVESVQSLEAWMKSKTAPIGFRASDLVAQVKVLNVSADAIVSMRLADRMLQKHKQLRNIKLFGANNWCWVKAT